MSTEKTASSGSVSEPIHKSAFFRHSGWLMIATVGGGVLTYAVHFLSKRVSEADYGVFVAMLAVTIFMPTMPLQMIFAQQTARAIALKRENELAGMIRLVWFGLLAIWAVAAVLAFVFEK